LLLCEFTQPQLLAILCLMRYEDWTFREAEVRLAEDPDLLALKEHEGIRIVSPRAFLDLLIV